MRALRSLPRTLALLGSGSVAVITACSSDTEIGLSKQQLGPSSDAESFAERDFVRDTSLRSGLGATVVLDLEPPGAARPNDTATPGTDVIPYRAERDEVVRFCLDATATDVISEFALVDVTQATRPTVLRLTATGTCESVALARGDYEARVTHAPSTSPEAAAVFVHATARTDAPAPQCAPAEYVPDPLTGAPDDLWELQTQTQQLQSEKGIRLFTPRDRFDPAKGFRLARGVDGKVSVAAANGFVVAPGSAGFLGLFDPNDTKSRNARTTWAFTPVPDGAKWTFSVTTQGSFEAVWSKAAPDLVSYLPYFERLRVTLAMRFVPRGENLRILKAGEVALYEQDNYSGRAWVLNDAHLFPALLSNIVGFVQPRSVRVGCDTTLLAYSAPGRTGSVIRIGDNTPATAFSAPIASAEIVSTRAITISANSCTNCNLRRVNLSGHVFSRRLTIKGGSLDQAILTGATMDEATFENVALTQAVFLDASLKSAVIRGTPGARLDASGAVFDGARLDGATLTDVKLDRASLVGTVLERAALGNVSFDHAPLERASFAGASLRAVAMTNTDLTQTNLAAAGVAPGFALPEGQALPADPCNEPLSKVRTLNTLTGTRVRFTQLPPSLWRVLDLSDAIFDFGDLPANARNLQRQNLCGLRLRGIDLSRFDLTEASFAQSDLTRADLTNTQMSFVSFKGALLDQATFQYADLTAANFDNVIADSGTGAATFSGSLFAPASLVKARFTKVQMINATVKMPPAAKHEGALFDGGTFDGTDFTGSDLSGLSMVGSSFTKAVFVRTILSGARLGMGSRASVFSQAVFCGAKVRGANFQGAALTDALFPLVATTLPDLDLPSGPPTECAAVDLGGAATLGGAVISVDATCPDSVTPPPGQSCVDPHWTPKQEVVRPVCPPPRDGGIGPGKVKACYPCTSNCACATQRCAAGTCAGCADAGY